MRQPALPFRIVSPGCISESFQHKCMSRAWRRPSANPPSSLHLRRCVFLPEISFFSSSSSVPPSAVPRKTQDTRTRYTRVYPYAHLYTHVYTRYNLSFFFLIFCIHLLYIDDFISTVRTIMFNKCALWIYISFCLPGWWTLTLIILRRPVVALFGPVAPSRSPRTRARRSVYLSVLRWNALPPSKAPDDSRRGPPKIATTTRYLVTFYTFFFSIGLTGIFGIYGSSWRFLCRNS